MDTQQLQRIVEGALMVSDKPLGVDQLMALFDMGDPKPTREDVRGVLVALQTLCADRGIELVEVASGYRFQARADVAPWLNKLWEERKPRYSRALLETVAIIAYRQPITRGEIENIRGVAVSSGIIRTLLEREWVRVVGHRDVPGRPAVYATTKQFLDYFGLRTLAELPTLAELKDIDDLNGDLFAELDAPSPGAARSEPGAAGAAAAGDDEEESGEVAAEPGAPAEDRGIAAAADGPHSLAADVT